MKPAAFRYIRPDSVAEAVDLLASHGDDAAVLAGGQSLVPMLNMRLSTPALVVDVNGLDALSTSPLTRDGCGSVPWPATARSRARRRWRCMRR